MATSEVKKLVLDYLDSLSSTAVRDDTTALHIDMNTTVFKILNKKDNIDTSIFYIVMMSMAIS